MGSKISYLTRLKRALFTFTGRISTKREAPDGALCDESIAEGSMDEEKSAADGRFAAGRKLPEKVNKALKRISAPFLLIICCPPIVMLVWYTNIFLDGSFKNLWTLFSHQGFFTTI